MTNLDGSAVSFISDTDVLGENSAGVFQAFKYDLIAGSLTQETAFTSNPTGAASFSFKLSADGSSLFSSDTDGGIEVSGKLDIRRDATNFNFEVGYGTDGVILTQVGSSLSAIGGLGAYTLFSQDAALATLDKIKENIDNLSSLRGVIGAGLSRLEVAKNIASQQALETANAKSRIMDADVAEESAKLIANNVRQDAITAVLVQANNQPQLAIQLLTESI